jgi:hypothetical protein
VKTPRFSCQCADICGHYHERIVFGNKATVSHTQLYIPIASLWNWKPLLAGIAFVSLYIPERIRYIDGFLFANHEQVNIFNLYQFCPCPATIIHVSFSFVTGLTVVHMNTQTCCGVRSRLCSRSLSRTPQL